MNDAARIKGLRQLGWRIRTHGEFRQAVRNFQRGWNLGPALAEDGHAGPAFDAALTESLERLHARKGTASTHFSFSEFACRCDGKFGACARIWVLRELLQTLEKVRTEFYPHGMTVKSGCRCNGHNNSVGGASSSQHLYGGACDISPVVPRQKMRAADVAAGIGYNLSSGKVSHIDRRDRSGHNTTGASLARPTVWIYHR